MHLLHPCHYSALLSSRAARRACAESSGVNSGGWCGRSSSGRCCCQGGGCCQFFSVSPTSQLATCRQSCRRSAVRSPPFPEPWAVDSWCHMPVVVLLQPVQPYCPPMPHLLGQPQALQFADLFHEPLPADTNDRCRFLRASPVLHHPIAHCNLWNCPVAQNATLRTFLRKHRRRSSWGRGPCEQRRREPLQALKNCNLPAGL
jgi:hypothetical protein